VRRKVSGIYSISIAFFLAFSLIPVKAQPARSGILDIRTETPLSTTVSNGQIPSRFQDKIVLQNTVGNCACGPCAIFNAFQFGDTSLTNLAWSLPGKTPADKVDSLIGMFGAKPSLLARNQPRYLARGGMWGADIAPFINDWLKQDRSASPVHGERLTLQNNETPRKQLQRVYQLLQHSLQQGFPPVVNLQSYTTRSGFGHADWTWLDGHFVTVLAVRDSLDADAGGFSMWVADSESGRVLQASVCAGPDHPFRAITSERVARDGGEIDSWTTGHPYLVIQSPKLEGILEGDAASSQTICVLQYLIHR
jgi:hypothetical protein